MNNKKIKYLVSSYGETVQPTLHGVELDCDSGTLTITEPTAGLSNPSFIAPYGDILFAVAENIDETSALVMLQRKGAGDWKKVDECALPGAGPCHVMVAPNGKYVVTANYGNGSISIIRFDKVAHTFGAVEHMRFTGKGLHPKRQLTPHAHFTIISPDEKLLIATDLGSDKLYLLPLDSEGYPSIREAKELSLPAGSGPRHLVFAEDGTTAYLINEIDGTVRRLIYDSSALTLIPQEAILADFEHGNGSADIRLHPDGESLYVSNRLRGDGIAVFDVDRQSGVLSKKGFIPTGRHPRCFVVAPNGRFVLVAARDDNKLECYSLNPDGTFTGNMISEVEIPRPVCIVSAV